MDKTQTRNWCLTVNNYTEDDAALIQGWEVPYVIYGKETGEEGTPHLQGYVNLSRNQRFSFVKKLHETAHWGPCKGSPEQNIAYCSKQGDTWSKGVAPNERLAAGRAAGGKRTMEEWTDIVEKQKLVEWMNVLPKYS